MLPIHDLSTLELLKIRIACSYLFSPELAKDDKFLSNLSLMTVKNAFSEKTKPHSLDIKDNESEDFVEEREDLFVMLKASYETLKKYFRKEDKPATDQTVAHPKIIAIGGVKGGTGKSTFAANLGIFLSSRGLRTVLVDLDLGSANLHLYLGKTSLEHNVNDFLNKRVSTISEIMIPTKYGPNLIGGDSSQLGAANINFARKLKLLRSLKGIDTDYVVIDLGGDTSYNIIDFFLAADHGFVLTTCYPASFLSAYNFMKVALYRRLNRLFGPESTFNSWKDRSLEQLIHDTTIKTNGNNVNNINQLIQIVKEQQPWNLSLLNGVLKNFNPKLIINMVDEDSNAAKMAQRIQDVSRKMLSIQVGYLGSVPFQPEIELSSKDLVPVVVRYPDGILTEKMTHMIEKIGHF
jgi:flagellar biosynthesis protein FlhG